jgi:hypothetical protein
MGKKTSRAFSFSVFPVCEYRKNTMEKAKNMFIYISKPLNLDSDNMHACAIETQRDFGLKFGVQLPANSVAKLM